MEDYKFLKVLGEGYSGEVVAVADKNGQEYALKSLSKNDRGGISEKVKREVSIHSSLTHPNIVKFIKNYTTLTEVVIVMEKCDDNLQDLLIDYKTNGVEMAIDEALNTFENLCSAIFYMHNKGFVHRDIKPENLLKKGKAWKLCDFGFSDDAMKRYGKIKGTLEFISPEAVIAHETENFYMGMPADIWAMGVCLYEMLYLKSPFTANKALQIYTNIKRGVHTFSGRDIGDNVKRLIESMLIMNPDERIVIEVLYIDVMTAILQ